MGRDEIFRDVFARRIEVAKEVMIVGRYGFDGSRADKMGQNWFIEMIHKTNPDLSKLRIVAAYNKDKEKNFKGSLKEYKQQLLKTINDKIDRFSWGANMLKHVAVTDPDRDNHETRVYIDRNYYFTWDLRFAYFGHERTKGDQKIYFHCSFGDPSSQDLKKYFKFRSISEQAV